MLVVLALVLGNASVGAAEAADEEIRLLDQVVWTNDNGDVITTDGTILEESGDQIKIKSRVAEFPIKLSAIKGEIKRRRTPDVVYKDLTAKLRSARSDADRGSMSLKIGLFCVRPNAALGGEAPLTDPAIGPQRAFGHLYKAVQLNPRNVQAYPWLLDLLARAREGGQAGKPVAIEEEVDVYMLARAGGYEHPEIDFRLAEILKDRLGRPTEAIKLYRKVFSGTESQPKNQSLIRSARRSLASIYLARGEMDQALALFARPAGPGIEAPAEGTGSPADFEGLYQAALLYFERATPADRAQARSLFTKAQALQPDFPGIARYLAALDYADGKLGPAQSALLRLVDSGIDDPGLKVDLAIVEIQAGKFTRALKRLNALLGDAPAESSPVPPPSGSNGSAVEPAAGPQGDNASVPAGSVDAERSRAYLARGMIFDIRGGDALARGDYRRALILDPSSALAALLAAGADLRAGDPASARAILAGLIKENAGKRGLFAAYARMLADVEIADGQGRKALNLLEYAFGIDSVDPLLRRKMGALLLSLKELERAAAHLQAAEKVLLKDPALLNALGYWRYSRGEFEDAEKKFSQVKGLVPLVAAKEGQPPPPVPPLRSYADMGIQFAQDAQRMEVWTDDFNRKDGGEVAMNWREEESFGISAGVQENKLVFSGQQSNKPGGVTRVFRDEDALNVERLSVKLRFDAQSGRPRAGIRIEAVGAASAGLVFFRDYDGTLRFSRKTSRSDWEDAVPPAAAGEKAVKSDKLIFSGDVKWPEGDQYHTLLIRRVSGAGSAASTYDLFLDQKPVAQNVSVEGLRGKTFQVGVSGQAEKLDEAYRFEADDFRLYRERQQKAREIQR